MKTVLPLRSIAGPHGSRNLPYILQEALIWQHENKQCSHFRMTRINHGKAMTSTPPRFLKGKWNGGQNPSQIACATTGFLWELQGERFHGSDSKMYCPSLLACVRACVRALVRGGLPKQRHLGYVLELLDRVEVDLIVVYYRVDDRPEICDCARWAGKER